jgi:hypothetical protein
VYQNKIPAFKEITATLIEFKKFCVGRIAYFEGNEYSPFYNENIGTLAHRTKIANASENNSIFLSQDSRNSIDNLINTMSILCSAEIVMITTDYHERANGIKEEYDRLQKMTGNCIDILYKDLNLKRH